MMTEVRADCAASSTVESMREALWEVGPSPKGHLLPLWRQADAGMMSAPLGVWKGTHRRQARQREGLAGVLP